MAGTVEVHGLRDEAVDDSAGGLRNDFGVALQGVDDIMELLFLHAALAIDEFVIGTVRQRKALRVRDQVAAVGGLVRQQLEQETLGSAGSGHLREGLWR